MKTKPLFWTVASVLVLSMVGSLPGVAQDANQSAPPAASSGGWRKFQPQDQQADQQLNAPVGAPDAAGDPAGNPPPGDPQNQPPPRPQVAPPPRYAPTTITLPAGTWVSARLIERLSSDHNQTGDSFTATLLEPIIANGMLIARRGQTVRGVVTEAQKAGRVSGVSHLKLELTEIQLADGRQVQVKTKLIDRRGNTSYGRDAFAIRSHYRNRRGNRRGREWRRGSRSGRRGRFGGLNHRCALHAWPRNRGWS